jgi:hypothetical protein
MTKRAILFVAWGESYIAGVAKCIAESQLPPYPIILITDESTAITCIQNSVTVIRRGFDSHGKSRKVEALADLDKTIGTALFLDTDTRVLGDVSLGFDKAEQHGMAIVPAPHYSLADFRSFGEIMRREGVPPRGQVIYNSGVIFFDWRSPAVRDVFQRGFALATKQDVDRFNDQPYISLAMEMAGFNPYTLSPSFNYRGFGELISGSIRIWHSCASPPPDATLPDPGYLRRYEAGALARVLKVPT